MDQITPAQAWTEAERLAALEAYGILDTPHEKAFDDVVILLSQLLDAPIAAVSLIADCRQWFKSEVGLGVREVPLDDSICKLALFQKDRMVVPDTRHDPRFNCNPLVTGAPGLRFYAGALLQTPEGLPLGTLCVLDLKPRPEGLTSQQIFVLETLAQQVMSQIELRKALKHQQALLKEQKSIQLALTKERDQSQRLLEGMDEGFIFLDEQFSIRQINTGAMKFELRSAEEIIGRSHWEVWPGSESLPVAQHYRKVMNERVPVSFEENYVFPDGRSFWLDIRAYPAEGGIVAFYRNITDRKAADQALRKSKLQALKAARRAEEERRRLDALLEAAPVGIAVVNASGKLVHVNAENRRLWGNHPMSATVDDYKEWNGWWADGSKRQGQLLQPHEWSLARALHGEESPRQVVEIEAFDFPYPRRIILNSGAPIRDGKGQITGAVVAQMDITDRIKAEKALLEADQKKDEFLAMLAHELRNPLAPISSAAALLKLSDLPPHHVRATADIISRQVNHMTGLVDDLLDVSRVTTGFVSLAKETVDIRRVIADAVEQVRPLIELQHHNLSIQMGMAPADVLGDYKRLVQVLSNMLNNAAKYTPEGGKILVQLDTEDSTVVIRVTDNGSGIPRDLLPNVFDLFSQAKRTSDRSQGGLGLGLALVKSLVELHGGQVFVKSEGNGTGSQFKVTLPLLVKLDSEQPSSTDFSQHSEPMSRRTRLLVVDDNVDAAEMLAMFLEAKGYRVAVEHDANKALERATREEFDAYLLDIGLPGMDGNELARRLRELPKTKPAMMIAITGYGNQFDRETSLKAGFDEYVVKPADPVKILQLVNSIS